MEPLNTTRSTATLIAIRDLGETHNIPRGQFALHAQKSPNAWTKIETGQTALTMEAYLAACSALNILPSSVMGLVERLVNIFLQNGVYFHPADTLTGEDDVIDLINKFYKSHGYKNLIAQPNGYVPVEVLFNFNNFVTPTVVKYCCDEAYRKWIDDGVEMKTISDYASGLL